MRRILWTGGFDSTWLVIDALLAGERVEAIVYRSAYIGHIGWHKPANEDEAQRRIIHALPTSLTDHLGFNVIDSVPHRLPYDVFHEPWHRLREHSPFNATRYAALENAYEVRAEGARPLFNEYKLWADQDWIVGAIPRLTPSPVPLETGYVGGDSLFKPGKTFRADALGSLGLAFPLRNKTKRDLLADARKRGFDHLLAMTWSCEGGNEATKAEGCGTCTPCRLRIIAQHGWA